MNVDNHFDLGSQLDSQDQTVYLMTLDKYVDGEFLYLIGLVSLTNFVMHLILKVDLTY